MATDMELSPTAKTGLKQAEMGLLVLFGAGYFSNEEWIQIDGLIHKGKYEFTEGPPRNLLDGYDSPLLEANDSKAAILPVNEEDIEPIEPIDGKSVDSEEHVTGQDIWDQSEPTETIEPAVSVTSITGSAVSSQVDVTPKIPASIEEVIPTSGQSDTVVHNGESRTGTPLPEQQNSEHYHEPSSEQYPERSHELYLERSREQTPEGPRAKPIPTGPASESKLLAVLRKPSRHLDQKYKVPGAPINIVYVAARAFDPEPEMQLQIRPGDHIQVVKFIVKNWYYGRNLRTKLFGQFNQDVVQVEPYSRMKAINPAEYGPIPAPKHGPRQTLAIEAARHSNHSLPNDPSILDRHYIPGQSVNALLTAQRTVGKDHLQRLECEIGDPIRIQKLLSGVTFTGINLRTEQHGQIHREVFDRPSGMHPHASTASRLGYRDYETEAARDWQDDTSVSGSVRSDARSHIRSGSSAAPAPLPWRSTRLSGLQASAYADPVPARNASPASVMSAQEIERLVNQKVKEVLKEQSPIPSPIQTGINVLDDKARVVCWWWATPGETCRYEPHTCKHLHYYPVDGVVAPHPSSKRPKDKERPKKAPKMLTCWFWHSQGHCDNSEEQCKFSHRWTGEVADKPFWIKVKDERKGDAEYEYGEEEEEEDWEGQDKNWDHGDDWRREDALRAPEDRVWGSSLRVQEVEAPVEEVYDVAAAKQKALAEGAQWW